MPSLKQIQSANASRTLPSPTAVFTGATSGIGLGCVEALLKHTTSPRIIIIGRSRAKFEPTLHLLHTLNPKAEITFLEAQISLLHEVDRICALITAQTSSLDYLWLSSGGLANATHALNEEGINRDLAVNYYSRLLLVDRLLPLLRASKDPRIVSVLCAGQEGALNTADLGLEKPESHGLMSSNKQAVTLTSLAMRELSLQNLGVSFAHANPGMVSTSVHDRWITSWIGPWTFVGKVLLWTLVPLFHALGYTPEQAGEVGLYELTDGKFRAEEGGNWFRVGESGEVLGTPKVLSDHERGGEGERVWEHTVGVFERVLGSA